MKLIDKKVSPLYKEGLSDTAIAAQLHCQRVDVRMWRLGKGLAANGRNYGGDKAVSEQAAKVLPEAEAKPALAEKKTKADKQRPSYGQILGDKIRAEANFDKLSDFEKFVLDRGFYYNTEETLKAAYDRVWKSRHDILISEDEFILEAGCGGANEFSQWDDELTRKAYNTLAELAAEGKISNSEVYRYARFCWCIRTPEAIVAYQEGCDKYLVNNCSDEITPDEARVKVCEEWGFEASRVRIVGRAYYNATDWQFIRFDCAHMSWLWQNGNLIEVIVEQKDLASLQG